MASPSRRGGRGGRGGERPPVAESREELEARVEDANHHDRTHVRIQVGGVQAGLPFDELRHYGCPDARWGIVSAYSAPFVPTRPGGGFNAAVQLRYLRHPGH